jgi:hypothetical protein
MVFAPPQGFLFINGREQAAFTYAFSGLNPTEAATSSAQFLHATLVALLVIGISELLILFFGKDRAEQVMKPIEQFANSSVPQKTMQWVQAFVHALQAFLLVAFFIFYVSLEHVVFPAIVARNLGGGADAIQAGQYSSIHLGIGLLAMLIGIAIAGLPIWRKVATALGILLVVGIILAIFHSSLLGQFLHLVGF